MIVVFAYARCTWYAVQKTMYKYFTMEYYQSIIVFHVCPKKKNQKKAQLNILDWFH